MSDEAELSSDGEEAIVGTTGDSDDYTHYVPAHSDYLIHWTGSDIDKADDPEWFKTHTSLTNNHVTRRYLERLRGILRHGLWMTDDDETIKMAGQSFKRPPHCRTCFTELKLSMVRGHARQYGRLGIGFKRFFVFDRLGCPMSYYHEARPNWFTPSLWAGKPTSYDEFFACFLKPMTTITPDTTMKYSFYDESEWRIIYSDALQARLESCGQPLHGIVPKNEFSTELNNYLTGIPTPPKAVIPVHDRWFAMIIYPSLAVKIAAQSDAEIRSLIDAIKPSQALPQNFQEGNPAWLEQYGKPIELDLDACKHF